jgi:hypothetical protein
VTSNKQNKKKEAKMKKLLLISCGLVIAAAVEAQIIHVPGDYPTIQQGINAANPGDTVLVADSIYYENINFLGKKPLFVTSHFIMDGDTNHINSTIINGSQPVNPDIGSVVTFTSGEDSTSVLCGFTITGGTGTFVAIAGNARFGGGVVILGCGGKLLNNHIEYNIVTNDEWTSGGGVCALAPVTTLPWVVLRGNRIFHNKAISINNEGDGGGVECFYNLIMTDNQISFNEANGPYRGDGGGVRIRGDIGPVELYLRNNVITYNKSISVSDITDAVLGGGLDIYYNVSGSVSNNIISFNEMQVAPNKWAGGSGVLIELEDFPHPDFIFENNIIANNTFTGNYCIGGGLLIFTSGGKFQNNVIRNNDATRGGGVAIEYNSSANRAILINNNITGNNADWGGGLYMNSADAVVFNTIIWDNTSPNGASIYETGSTLEVRYSDVQGDFVWPGEGNIIEEPQFQIDGYHLDVPGLLMNGGISEIYINSIKYDCPEYDIDGEMRPYSSTQPEIGVDELQETSIGDLISTNKLTINVYPNPANEKITISSPSITGNTQLSIFNVNGEKVIERTLIDNETQLDISGLPQGVYFVRVQNETMVQVSNMVKE